MDRRRFLTAAGLSAGAAGMASASGMGQIAESLSRHQRRAEVTTLEELPSLEGRKVLYTHGGWNGHEPKKSIEIFRPWLLDQGAEVDVFDNLDPYADEDYMKEIDLVIQIVTMAEISKEQENGLLKAVKQGCGLAGWHGGLCDSFRQNVAYQFMTGGQWVAHPGGVIDYHVQIKDQSDPVTAGLEDFDMHSEQYYLHVDPNMKVLATTTFSAEHAPWIEGATMPVVWKKMFGKGRVFYSSLGHVMKDFEVPQALEIQKRGIRWASASRYQAAEPWIKPVY